MIKMPSGGFERGHFEVVRTTLRLPETSSALVTPPVAAICSDKNAEKVAFAPEDRAFLATLLAPLPPMPCAACGRWSARTLGLHDGGLASGPTGQLFSWDGTTVPW